MLPQISQKYVNALESVEETFHSSELTTIWDVRFLTAMIIKIDFARVTPRSLLDTQTDRPFRQGRRLSNVKLPPELSYVLPDFMASHPRMC